MLSQVLFNPKVNRFISKLDDEKSMFSIAIRDGVDNAGRTYQEWKRSPHGGRERLLEEVITTLIWGFGINFMKSRVYDPLVKKFTSGAKHTIQYPDVDMALLGEASASVRMTPALKDALKSQFPKAYQALEAQGFKLQPALAATLAKDAPGAYQLLMSRAEQRLTTGIVDQFSKKFPDAYKGLRDVVSNKTLQNAYHHSNVAKFLIATGIPVFLIGFGIPTLNQWLTKKALTPKEGGSPLPTFSANGHQGLPAGTLQGTLKRKPIGFNAFEQALYPGKHFGKGPQFGGFESVGLAVSNILQQERYNTLIVDGIISGGRTYKARNWIERAEILFREATIIFFLYFAQRPIQNRIGQMLDKSFHAVSELDFQAMRSMHEKYKTCPSAFHSDLKKGIQELFGGKIPASEALADVEQAVLERIRAYFLSGRTDNLLLESAKISHWIPTFEHAAAGKAPKTLLDLTKKIHTEKILAFAHHLETFAEQVNKTASVAGKTITKHSSAAEKELFNKAFNGLLRRSNWARLGSLVLANGVCAVFLSYVGPKIQHFITYKITGKDYFPGLEG